MLVKKSLLAVKPDIMEEILVIQEKLFKPTDRVLSVKLRGTDYFALKPKDHSIPPLLYKSRVRTRKSFAKIQADRFLLIPPCGAVHFTKSEDSDLRFFNNEPAKALSSHR